MPAPALTPVRHPFRALAEAFVPEAAGLTEEQWARAEANLERSLEPRPEGMKRQLRIFLRAVDLLGVARFGRRLRSVDPERRRDFLERLEKAPLLTLRRGVWGARTLAFMAVYGLPEVRRQIGYRAHLRGWEQRRATEDEGPRTPAEGKSDAPFPPAPDPTV